MWHFFHRGELASFAAVVLNRGEADAITLKSAQKFIRRIEVEKIC